ncbi:sigma-70 family RNA polymerase sigma factor [Dactylosporangium siamense]|uniref:DNA-directed RNA polymerase sigma-70 factor n=1 Tax=Dactylosporangium siamense TaxID=685454 RepID=A0A919PMS3_9ACTN|nr:sigma-70 family RNA polymerase sigma factor [Dactylosporangium siamense]GIG46071.1 DNA-directed RNA polymerase sigma-70 factor [Dactylosporangium siamense]
MDDSALLAARFEEHRGHLLGVAYRMLGARVEAEDAVQEAWLRLSRSDHTAVDNLGGWLTTVVGRICLDQLRSRKTAVPVVSLAPTVDPEHEAILADDVGQAMLVVLDTLTPAERLAFVLHDLFAVPFEDIATVVGRTPAAARQLASRGRRRVQGADAPRDPDLPRQREVVDAFLAASRGGDFEALLALLDPDVVLRADAATVLSGAAPEVHGADAVAATFTGRARGAQTALVDGFAGLVWSVGGSPRVVFDFVVEDGKVVEIELLGDPVTLDRLDLEGFPA